MRTNDLTDMELEKDVPSDAVIVPPIRSRSPMDTAPFTTAFVNTERDDPVRMAPAPDRELPSRTNAEMDALLENAAEPATDTAARRTDAPTTESVDVAVWELTDSCPCIHADDCAESEVVRTTILRSDVLAALTSPPVIESKLPSRTTLATDTLLNATADPAIEALDPRQLVDPTDRLPAIIADEVDSVGALKVVCPVTVNDEPT